MKKESFDFKKEIINGINNLQKYHFHQHKCMWHSLRMNTLRSSLSMRHIFMTAQRIVQNYVHQDLESVGLESVEI